MINLYYYFLSIHIYYPIIFNIHITLALRLLATYGYHIYVTQLFLIIYLIIYQKNVKK